MPWVQQYPVPAAELGVVAGGVPEERRRLVSWAVNLATEAVRAAICWFVVSDVVAALAEAAGGAVLGTVVTAALALWNPAALVVSVRSWLAAEKC